MRHSPLNNDKSEKEEGITLKSPEYDQNIIQSIHIFAILTKPIAKVLYSNSKCYYLGLVKISSIALVTSSSLSSVHSRVSPSSASVEVRAWLC